MIKLEVIGHLGNDAIVNTVNNKTVINFSLCHSESYLDTQGQKRDKSVWISCAYWSEKTNIANYLKKGTQIYVVGTPDVKLYTDKQNNTLPQLTLRVREIQLLSSKNNTTTQVQQPQISSSNDVADDLPF